MSPQRFNDDPSRDETPEADRSRFKARPPLLIIAASGRALAASARRAGFQPTVIDGFADADLARMATAHRVELGPGFAAGVVAVAQSLAPTPFVYGGGLENEPELIEALSRRHALAGVAPDRLPNARDPDIWMDRLTAESVPHAGRGSPNEARRDPSRWLAKPFRSAGGLGVRPWSSDLDPDGSWIQEFLEGRLLGSLHLATDRGVELIGATWSRIVGSPFEGPHQYSGSVGPIPLDPLLRKALGRAGEVVGESLGAVGLFGVDHVVRDGIPHVIEINPRPTATVEIHEFATGRTLLGEHLATFGHRAGPIARPPSSAAAGRRILHAPHPARAPDDWVWPDEDPVEFPGLADLPRPGTPFTRGEPILTLFATASTVDRVESLLDRLEDEWRTILKSWATV